MSIGDALDHLDELDRRIIALESDIGRCACLSPAQLDEWAAWRTEARSYMHDAAARLDHVKTALNAATLGGALAIAAAESWTDREVATIEQQTASHAAELATWQQRAAAAGASLSAPGEPAAFHWPWLTIALVGLGAVGVVALGVYVARRAPRPKYAREDYDVDPDPFNERWEHATDAERDAMDAG